MDHVDVGIDHQLPQRLKGEVRELRAAFQTSRTEDGYFSSISGKTASLLAAACRIGALVTDQPRSQVDALTEYGEAFGTVFQIVDDIKDLVLSTADLGKPAGHDLVEGVYTLPVLRALAMPEAGAELRALLGRPIERPDADKARAIVVESGGVESAVLTARQWADRARSALAPLGGRPEVDMLGRLGHVLLDHLPA